MAPVAAGAEVFELHDPSRLDDERLLKALKAGHARAPGAFFDRFHGHVERLLTRIFGADSDVADMTNDVFLRALDRIEALTDAPGIRPWLTSIGVNVAREQIRSRRRRSWLRFLPTEIPERAAPIATAETVEAVKHLYAALDTMPDAERVAFALRFVEGMELSEVAAACDVSLATIKRTLTRAETRFVAIGRRDAVLRDWLEGGAMGRPMSDTDVEAALARLGREAARLQDAALAQRPGVDARARFEAALRSRPARATAPSRRVAWGVAVVAAVAAAVVGLYVSRPRELSFRVADAKGEVGAWVVSTDSSADGAGIPLRFSDGTLVTLGADSFGRVESLSAAGAEIVVPRGQVHASVVHTPTSRWKVDVGPFVVQVTGTEFDTAWDPGKGVFTLDLHNGSVLVSGCGIEPQLVRAGTSMQLRCDNGRIVASSPRAAGSSPPEEGAPIASVPSPLPPPSASAEPEEPSPIVDAGGRDDPAAPHVALPKPATSTPDLAPEPSWRDLAARGANREALAAALPHFDDECSHASAPDSMSLADAARYAGDAPHARAALLAIRARFGGTSQATTAAFLLGRQSFDGGAFADAARWFEATVTEAPNGPLARDAEGRFIEAEERAGNHAAARQAAQRYLQRYPSGPHASLAIHVLER